LQAHLLAALRRLPCLKLLGDPIPDDHLQRILLDRTDRKKFLSVDYEDATNQMHSWCSEIIGEEIADVLKLTSLQRELVITALTRHTLVCDGQSAKQTRGQLMGSIMSFPVLCLANLSLLRWVWEKDSGCKISLASLPCLVNGDDAVLCLSNFGYNLWLRYSRLMGLNPSIGKVYFSESFLNINSMSFCLERGSLTRVPYVNMGLLRGVKRSGNNSNDRPDSLSFGSRCRDLIKGCPLELSERVMGQFIYRHKKFLSKVAIPWFLPEHLLGLGLPSAGKFQPATADLARLGVYFDKHLMLPKRPPLPVSSWRCWEYAKERLPRYQNFLLVWFLHTMPMRKTIWLPRRL